MLTRERCHDLLDPFIQPNDKFLSERNFLRMLAERLFTIGRDTPLPIRGRDGDRNPLGTFNSPLRSVFREGD